MKFYLLSNDEDTLVGMRLAGIEGEMVSEKEALLSALEKVTSDESVGIVMINTNLSSMIESEIIDYKKNSSALIVEIPDKGSTVPGNSITQYVRNAIGINI